MVAQRRLAIFESVQRPIVQQQQDKGQRHQHRLGAESDGKRSDDHQIPTYARLLGVPDVREDRHEREQSAQYVLAFRDPGDRFDVRGVYGEQKGDQCAGPNDRRHAKQHVEQKTSVRGVEDQVG